MLSDHPENSDLLDAMENNSAPQVADESDASFDSKTVLQVLEPMHLTARLQQFNPPIQGRCVRGYANRRTQTDRGRV